MTYDVNEDKRFADDPFVTPQCHCSDQKQSLVTAVSAQVVLFHQTSIVPSAANMPKNKITASYIF